MGKPLDQMWEYGEPCEDDIRTKMRCKLYGIKMFGGITHLKYHLAKIPVHDVDIFPIATQTLSLLQRTQFLLLPERDIGGNN